MKMNNFSEMLSKAKKMQEQMKEVQENIKKIMYFRNIFMQQSEN